MICSAVEPGFVVAATSGNDEMESTTSSPRMTEERENGPGKGAKGLYQMTVFTLFFESYHSSSTPAYAPRSIEARDRRG